MLMGNKQPARLVYPPSLLEPAKTSNERRAPFAESRICHLFVRMILLECRQSRKLHACREPASMAEPDDPTTAEEKTCQRKERFLACPTKRSLYDPRWAIIT